MRSIHGETLAPAFACMRRGVGSGLRLNVSECGSCSFFTASGERTLGNVVDGAVLRLMVRVMSSHAPGVNAAPLFIILQNSSFVASPGACLDQVAGLPCASQSYKVCVCERDSYCRCCCTLLCVFPAFCGSRSRVCACE